MNLATHGQKQTSSSTGNFEFSSKAQLQQQDVYNKMRLPLLPVLLVLFLIALATTTTSVHCASSGTLSRAATVLADGNITAFINTAFSSKQWTFTTQQLRRSAEARFAACVPGTRFQAVADSAPFLSAAKRAVRNVSECLSYCAATRRLDYWVQSALPENMPGGLPVLELVAAVDTNSKNCWCLPQNMTTLSDVELWHRATYGGVSLFSKACCDVWGGDDTLPDDVRPSLGALPLGATGVSSGSRADQATATCNATGWPMSQPTYALFEMTFFCGLADSCSPGCVKDPNFNIPFDAMRPCTPVSFDIEMEDDSTPLDPLSITLIVLASIFLIGWISRALYVYRRNAKEKERRDRLVPVTAASSNAGTTIVNNSGASATGISSLMSPLNAGGSGGDAFSPPPQISAADAAATRELLSRLPTTALSVRSLYEARAMALSLLEEVARAPESRSNINISYNKNKRKDSVAGAAALEEPLPQLHRNSELPSTTAGAAASAASAACKTNEEAAASSGHNNADNNCPICLEAVEVPPDGTEINVARMATALTLPNCGHRFHALCLHRQLVYEAQRLRDLEPVCAVCGVLIEPEVGASTSAAAAAGSAKRRVVSSNPLA